MVEWFWRWYTSMKCIAKMYGLSCPSFSQLHVSIHSPCDYWWVTTTTIQTVIGHHILVQLVAWNDIMTKFKKCIWMPLHVLNILRNDFHKLEMTCPYRRNQWCVLVNHWFPMLLNIRQDLAKVSWVKLSPTFVEKYRYMQSSIFNN